MTLTRKQRELMDYLTDFIRRNGYSPTYEEIAERFGYRSLSTVHEHVRNLVGKGVLRVDARRSRSIEVLRRDDRAAQYPAVYPRKEWLEQRCDDHPVAPLEAVREELTAMRRYRERWRALRGEMLPGDELWTFRTQERAGYAVVREGVVVAGVVTHDRLAVPEGE